MRAYEAEDAVFRRRRHPLSMQESRDLAAKLFAHFGVEPILVQRTRTAGRTGSWFFHPHKGKPARIHLDDAAPDWIVCHEVAHYVVWDRERLRRELSGDRARNPGHGVEWATVYVEAVELVISEHYAGRLARSIRRHGIAVRLRHEEAPALVESSTAPSRRVS